MRRRERGPKQHHDSGIGELTTGRSLLAGAEARQPSQQFLQSKLKCNICYLKERFSTHNGWGNATFLLCLPLQRNSLMNSGASTIRKVIDLRVYAGLLFASVFLQKSISSE